jgi:hypothetical protein
MKVTVKDIEARIRHVTYTRGPGTITHCYLHLDNNFIHHGYSACVDPIEFDETLGREAAYGNAFGTLWGLMGFMLAEDMFRQRVAAELRERLRIDTIDVNDPFNRRGQ